MLYNLWAGHHILSGLGYSWHSLRFILMEFSEIRNTCCSPVGNPSFVTSIKGNNISFGWHPFIFGNVCTIRFYGALRPCTAMIYFISPKNLILFNSFTRHFLRGSQKMEGFFGIVFSSWTMFIVDFFNNTNKNVVFQFISFLINEKLLTYKLEK